MCERESERERDCVCERGSNRERERDCVCERGSNREKERERERETVCVREAVRLSNCGTYFSSYIF